INDTTDLLVPGMAEAVSETGASVVIEHSLANPHRHYHHPTDTDVVTKVTEFLTAQVDRALMASIPADRLIVDPVNDLNKNTAHSLELTRRLDEVAGIGPPTLVALSNRDFVGETLDRARGDR